ncbi:MAG: hypothetical protein SWH61_03235 [Thermodesulfobacteriota bacterium]|nr:hypothetical protein [Thermodesulfobacteriota bacterium]
MPTFQNITSEYQTEIDINGDRQSVAPNATIKTYKLLDVIEPANWTRTDQSPHYPIAQDSHTVEASGAGFESQAVSVNAGVLEVRCDVAVTIHANDESAEGYPLAAGDSVQIRNDQTIEDLHLNFSEAGTATVIELKD